MGIVNQVGNLSDVSRQSEPLDGRYALLRCLGRGADGETWEAVDRAASDSPCAVKLIAAAVEGAAGRTVQEFARLSEMRHRNIVQVRALGRARSGRGLDGTYAGRLYLVTELIRGRPLRDIASVVDDGERRAAFERAALGLVDALAYLHSRGVVHGDVAPGNVCLNQEGQPILIDFGLAAMTALGARTGGAGTLGYAAPEALVGDVSPAGDLFALGATLFEAWSGAAPFGSGVDAVQRMLSGAAPRLNAVRPGLPAAWEDVIARLLSVPIDARPGSAREALRLMRSAAGEDASTADLVAPFPGGDVFAGVMVGRDSEREALRALVESLAGGACPVTVAALVGAPGSGRTSVAEAAARDAQIAHAAGLLPALEVVRGGLDTLQSWLGAEYHQNAVASVADPAQATAARCAALADALERRAQATPLLVVLPAGEAPVSFASFVAGAGASGRLLLLVPVERALKRPAASDIVLRPLQQGDVATLVKRAVGEEPPTKAVAEIVSASGGNAAVATLLARRLVLALREGSAEHFRVDSHDADAEALLASSLRALSGAARAALLWTALTGRDDAQPEHLGCDAAALVTGLEAARAAGWFRGDGTQLRSALHRRVLLAAVDTKSLRDVARAAAAVPGLGHAGRAESLLLAGDGGQAAAEWRAAARELMTCGDVSGASDHLRRAEEAAPGCLELHEMLVLAGGLGVAGAFDLAAAVLDRAEGCASDVFGRAQVEERRAWLLSRRGELARARQQLEQALAVARDTDDADAQQLLGGRLARLLVSTGRLAEAQQVAAPLLRRPQPGQAVLEAALLAHAYAGEAAAAASIRDRLAAGGEIAVARLAHLDGLMAQLSGRHTEAVRHYRRAFEVLAEGGDIQALATVAANLGTLLAEQGKYAEALPALERALRELGRLGARAELATTLYNAGVLFVLLGDTESARRAIERARAEVMSGGGGGLAGALATALEAELRRREGDSLAAAELFAEAAAALRRDGNPTSARAASLSRAEAIAEAGQPSLAMEELAAASPQDESPETEQDEALLLARARVVVAGGMASSEERRALVEALRASSERARSDGRLPAAWRAGLLAARLENDPGAAARMVSAARAIFEEIKMSTPIHHRAGLELDPEARLFSTAPGRGADGIALARSSRAEERLRRLIRVNKRLNSEQRLPRLLETIIDSVIELTEAERGFLLLEDDSGELGVKVARNIDQRTLGAAEFELSRSIAERAAKGGAPIITIDAAGDERFKQALSVSDLHLRSVLAVPLHVKGRAVGTIYVDHRLRKGAFSDEDIGMVLDFAEQAAIAIENARLLGELRRRERQIDALNRRLEAELAMRREELHGMRQELRENRDALAIRYDYKNIVGRTPRMLELFRLLDRITDTALPTVIYGESGTGKELVARALHFNGPRREQPFVSENCAAIPETLLESTLFGYVRGAFTGADHDTRGLFEIADRGTLFLDEVSEMSPAMQGKLLRVLQQGEFRRVGSERTRTVDVRVIAATNRDLARMVEEGKFRQDLYFRLKVASIHLPPLRERREDIPSLVEHFLAKSAAGKAAPKLVEPAAMSRLVAYRWPGNVRELENEVTRAAALSGPRITVADLSPHVAENEAALSATDDPGGLTLKPRVERLERMLIREALSRFDGNQTRAAEVLGLSRFGLQKKLRRYGLS